MLQALGLRNYPVASQERGANCLPGIPSEKNCPEIVANRSLQPQFLRMARGREIFSSESNIRFSVHFVSVLPEPNQPNSEKMLSNAKHLTAKPNKPRSVFSYR